jgi:hypothetical protein
MAIPSIQFKKMLLRNSQMDRFTILNSLERWMQSQLSTTLQNDMKSQNLMCWISNLNSLNHLPDKDFATNNHWIMATSFNDCVTFQRIVKSKLAIPPEPAAPSQASSTSTPKKRKTIPKKIRGQVWENHFGKTTTGSCYCCKKELNCLEDWHAGHIIASSNGGADTADNLRPVCVACNLAMGTEAMDAFKTRCYPSVTTPAPLSSTTITIGGRVLNILTQTH